MNDLQVKTQLTDIQALALTLWAEARGEPIEGIVGVGWVIRNRLVRHTRYRAAERSYRGVVFAPRQFSCWNASLDRNHVRLMEQAERVLAGDNISEDAWVECAWVAVGIVEDRLRDRAHGATHYLTSTLYRSPQRPSWASRYYITAELGAHIFLAEPRAEQSRPLDV